MFLAVLPPSPVLRSCMPLSQACLHICAQKHRETHCSHMRHLLAAKQAKHLLLCFLRHTSMRHLAACCCFAPEKLLTQQLCCCTAIFSTVAASCLQAMQGFCFGSVALELLHIGRLILSSTAISCKYGLTFLVCYRLHSIAYGSGLLTHSHSASTAGLWS